MTLRRIFLVALLMGVATPVHAQVVEPNSDLVDRVVAVVGDSVVLLTQVQEEVERMRAQNPAAVPSDPAALQRLYSQVVDNFVERLLILQAAAKDSLVQVDEARIEEILNQEMSQRAQQFGGQPALQQALAREGITLAEYRETLASQIRQAQLQQLYVQRTVQNSAPIDVSDEELRQAFQEAQGNLEERPKLVTLEQVVIAPSPSDSAMEVARVEAQQILDSIRAGADFEEMAKAHSQDPGSAENGGDLGWFRRGAMVREFEDAAFSMVDGQVSDLVKTDFGFHIIKLERSRAGERKGRHILIRPTLGPSDTQRAKALADSVAQMARNGTSMAELFDRYSDPLAPDTLTVSYEQLSQLPPGYEALRTASEGQVVGPLQYDTGRGETRLAVVRVRQLREAGEYTFEDVKSQLAQQVQRTKQLQRMLDQLRAKTYIEIRM